jgi:hypothetical protein
MRRREFAFLIILISLAHPLAASVLLPADFKDIVSGSQVIVHGRVVDVRSEWSLDRSQIESYVTIAPAAFYRGTPTASVTFRVPGGQVGRYKQVTVGAPQFVPGEEAIVFLRGGGPTVPQVFGLSQGVFRVRVDQRNGQRTVVLPILMARGPCAEPVTRGARARQPLPIDAFSAQLRAAVQGGGR